MKPVPREPVFGIRDLSFFKKNSFFPFNQEKIYLFGYARLALMVGLKVLGINQEDNVLIPSYICNVVLAPFNYLRIKVRYFEVDDLLNPKIDQINRIIDKKTKAILAVNYFGFPTRLEELREICRKYDLFLIEDNAHGFLSYFNGNPLGSFGDISIFSIKKTLPIPNGAILFINNEKISHEFHIKLRIGKSDIIFILKQLSMRVQLVAGIDPSMFIKRILHGKFILLPSEEGFGEEDNLEKYFIKLSSLSNWIIKRIDLEAIRITRRNMFIYWLNNLPFGQPVFERLPEGVVPYIFPVKTENVEKFIIKMLDKDIQCFTWPNLPHDLKKYPDFYKQIVGIPLWRNRAD